MTIIAFSGAQGVGKTTLRYKLYDYLTERGNSVFGGYAGVRDSISREAKRYGFEINEDGNLDTQMFIAHKYIAQDLATRQMIKKRGDKFCIVDRSVLDTIAYLNLSCDICVDNKKYITDMLFRHYSANQVLYFYVEPLGKRANIELIDNVRSNSDSYFLNVLNEFENLWKEMEKRGCYNMWRIPAGTVEERIEMVGNILRNGRLL